MNIKIKYIIDKNLNPFYCIRKDFSFYSNGRNKYYYTHCTDNSSIKSSTSREIKENLYWYANIIN